MLLVCARIAPLVFPCLVSVAPPHESMLSQYSVLEYHTSSHHAAAALHCTPRRRSGVTHACIACRDGIFWLPAGKDATERLPWLLEYLAVQLVLSCGGSGDNKASRLGALGARGNKQVREEGRVRRVSGAGAGGGRCNVKGVYHSGNGLTGEGVPCMFIAREL